MFYSSTILGGACRVRVIRSLRQRFSTPELAEQFFVEQNKENSNEPRESQQSQDVSCTRDENASSDEGSTNIESVDLLQPILEQVLQMKPEDQIQFVGEVFARCCSSQNVVVPDDFLKLALNGMIHLHNAGRSNVLYGLSKGFGCMRSDGSDTLFPCMQVVTGLVEHCVNFFNATYGDQVLNDID